MIVKTTKRRPEGGGVGVEGGAVGNWNRDLEACRFESTPANLFFGGGTLSLCLSLSLSVSLSLSPSCEKRKERKKGIELERKTD